MVDRQELDALLIGALYGELTPADEARLTAHLESHPTDRSALEGLKTARAAVRESQVFDRQVEPPQALSALLLQEAHRRAPRVKSESREHEDGWLTRFLRTFAAHPAMAAAATLVVVVGVASTVYMSQGKLETADTSRSRAVAATETPPAAASPAAAATAPAPAGAPSSSPNAGSAAAADPATEQASVDLATTRARPVATAAASKLPAERRDESQTANYYRAQNAIAFDGQAEAEGKSGKKAPTHGHAATKGGLEGGIEVPKHDLAPKDFDDSQMQAKAGDGLVAQTDAVSRGASGGGGASTGTTISNAASMAPAGPVVLAQPAAPPPPQAAAPTQVLAKASPPSKTVAKPKAQVSPAQANQEQAQANDKPAPPDAGPSWAQSELKQAIAAANDKDCKAVVGHTEKIHSGAPSFYDQNVADNIKLKHCISYMAAEAEKKNAEIARKAAKSKAQVDDTGAQAAPPQAAPPPQQAPAATKK